MFVTFGDIQTGTIQMGALYKHAKPLPESVTLSQIIQSIPKEVYLVHFTI